MGQYTDSIMQFLQYSLKVLPELKRQYMRITARSNCPAQSDKNTTGTGTGQLTANTPGTSLYCSSYFALHPCVDMKSALSFIISLYRLSDTLAEYRANAGIADELDIRKLYACLSGAVDPSRATGCVFADRLKAPDGPKREAIRIPCLSNLCRLELAVLPSFSLVAPKLKKYIQLYVDMLSYGNCPEEIRSEYLNIWSRSYLKRYRELSVTEFCAASGSLIGITAMYVSAADPGLTPAELVLIDEACFPWLCGLESLLNSYVKAGIFENPGSLNYCSSYRNLKDCEQRLSFFLLKAEEACMKLRDSHFYLSLIRILLGMYLSDHDAGFGMHRITSRNILKNGPCQSMLYYHGCKLLRSLNRST